MKKFVLLILVSLLCISVNAKDNYQENNKMLYTSYAQTQQELEKGIVDNLLNLEYNNFGKSVGGAMCFVNVLDNGDLALTFLSDEELESFHNQTDDILDKYYGGHDVTSFQQQSGNLQTHVTTMLLRRIEKKRFKLLKGRE